MTTDPSPPAPVTMFQLAAVGRLSVPERRQLQAEMKVLCEQYGLTVFSQSSYADD